MALDLLYGSKWGSEMAAFVCRMCGAALELTYNMRICRCGSCGVTQSVPLLDSDEKAEGCKNIERLRREGHYEKALELLEGMIKLSPTDPDLYWASVLCRYGVEFTDGGLSVTKALAKSLTTDGDYMTALKYADENQRAVMESAAAKIDKARRNAAQAADTSIVRHDILLLYGDGRADLLISKLTAAGYNVLRGENAGAAEAAIVFCSNAGEPDGGALRAFVCSGRAVIPVLSGISAEQLPDYLRKFQAADAGKLGWESDVLNGLSVVFGGKAYENTARKSSEPLLRRRYIMLEDGDFEGAERIAGLLLEKAANDPQMCAEAYLARLLCEYRIADEKSLAAVAADYTNSENYRNAMRLGSDSLRIRLRNISLIKKKGGV